VTTASTLAPTGSVTFYDNGTALGSATLGSGGTASITVAGLEPGTNSITGSYSGDGLHGGSSSVPLNESVTFDRCVDGGTGALTVHAGQAVCVRGIWAGTISVQSGGAIALLNAHVIGAVTSNGAAAVTVCGSSVALALTVSGSSGAVVLGIGPHDATVCAGNSFAGSVAMRGNTGGVELAGNVVTGSLACSQNSPAPIDGGRPNTVIGARSGQCAASTF
jgi:Bacterial Ig-like domain (group 3)